MADDHEPTEVHSGPSHSSSTPTLYITQTRGRSASSALDTLSILSGLGTRTRSSSQGAMDEIRVMNPLYRGHAERGSVDSLLSPASIIAGRPRKQSMSSPLAIMTTFNSSGELGTNTLSSSPSPSPSPSPMGSPAPIKVANPLYRIEGVKSPNGRPSSLLKNSSEGESAFSTLAIREVSHHSSRRLSMIFPLPGTSKSEKIRSPLIPLNSAMLSNPPAPRQTNESTKHLQEGILLYYSPGTFSNPIRYFCQLTKDGHLNLKNSKDEEAILTLQLLGCTVLEIPADETAPLRFQLRCPVPGSASPNFSPPSSPVPSSPRLSSPPSSPPPSSPPSSPRLLSLFPSILEKTRSRRLSRSEEVVNHTFEAAEEFDHFNWMVKLKKACTLLNTKASSQATLSPRNAEVKTKPQLKLPPKEDSEREGYLLFKSNTRGKWKKRHVVLRSTYLSVYKPQKLLVPVASVSVLLCSARVAKIKTKQNYCFEVVHADATLRFAAETGQLMMSWISVIQVAQAKSMNECLDYKLDISKAVSLPSEESSKAKLAHLLSLPVNRTCVDCDSTEPIWASINLGVFFCLDCSGIHRALGVHISKVRSVTMDKWDESVIQVMERMGNKSSNEYWEATLYDSGWLKPVVGSSLEERQKFITAKYRDKTFVAKVEGEDLASPPAEESLLSSTSSSGFTLDDSADVSFSSSSPFPGIRHHHVDI